MESPKKSNAMEGYLIVEREMIAIDQTLMEVLARLDDAWDKLTNEERKELDARNEDEIEKLHEEVRTENAKKEAPKEEPKEEAVKEDVKED